MITIDQSQDALGGVARLVAVSPEALRRIRKNYALGTSYLELYSNKLIVDIPDVGEKQQVTETHSIGDTGHVYQVSCKGVIYRSTENENIAEILRHGKWMVLAVDALGSGRFFGSLDNLLYFTSDDDTGTLSTDSNRIAFEFSGEQPKKGVTVIPFTSTFF